MKLKSIAITTTLCALSLVCGRFIALADDTPESAPEPEAEKTLEDHWKEYSQPGPNHELLAKRVGTWKCVSEAFTGGEPVRNEGTVERTMILDGRYLREEMTTTFMNKEVHGLGICGFDNGRKEYFYIWLDNMTTGLSYSFGAREGNVRRMTGYMSSPIGNMQFSTRTNFIDDDTDVFELYLSQDSFTPEQLVQRITYTRVK